MHDGAIAIIPTVARPWPIAKNEPGVDSPCQRRAPCIFEGGGHPSKSNRCPAA